jgi:nicotinamide-nucleotide amidase
MSAEIITIGTELLHGLVRNTNADRILDRLAEIGVEVTYQTTVGDDTARLSDAFRAAGHRARFVITTGGLGPTPDDLTRKVVATVFRRRLVLDETVLAHIRARFKARGIDMPAINEAQALVPRGARVIENPRGTAPGLHFEHQETDFFVLPGVPAEADAMLAQYVIPSIKATAAGPWISRRVVRTIGLSESVLAERLIGVEGEAPDVMIGYLPHSYGLDVTLTVLALDPSWAAEAIRRIERRVIEAAGDHVYGFGRDTMATVLGALLVEQGRTIATAESFTAGGIGANIASVPGASRYFLGGVTAYSNAAKTALLGVKKALIDKHGAVSAEVAEAMAAGARERFGADIAISSTGIAGPDGGTPEKPVGLFFLGLATPEGVHSVHRQVGGEREEIVVRSSALALDFVRRRVAQAPQASRGK